MSISTPLDPGLQIAALNSLRFGIEEYDRRKGWRGPIANKFTNNNWKEILEKINLDKTLKWEIAEVIQVNENISKVKFIKNKKEIQISFENLKWTKKKDFSDLLNVGDFIFRKKFSE